MSIFVSIVTFNSEAYIERCIESVLSQASHSLGKDIFIQISDNASSDSTLGVLDKLKDQPGVSIVSNESNLGFCAGQNQGVTAFLDSECEYFLMLNPDVVLEPECLLKITEAFGLDSSIGSITPRLLRANEDLKYVEPKVIDATGIILSATWRHFDRGSESLAANKYKDREFVFGGTGACLMLKRECVKDCLLEAGCNEALFSVHPELKAGYESRKQLLDEAFFAFREDAELAFRANTFGWRCLYEPNAKARHKRSVLPENRKDLSKFVNRLGVRNRFLLQILHFKFSQGLIPFVFGILMRNILVLLAVFFCERSSLPAFRDVKILFERCLARRKAILERKKEVEINWFISKGKSLNDTK